MLRPPVRDGKVGQIPVEEFLDFELRQCLLQHEFQAFVRERRGCTEDAECTTVRTWCPFGTGVAVAKRYAAAVSEKYQALTAEYAKLADCTYKAGARGDNTCLDGECDFVGGKSPLSR